MAAPIDGDEGDNYLSGTEGDDVIRGFEGNDNLSGLGGIDILYGGTGNDRLVGGNGIDTLYGGGGDDTLSGVGTAVLLSTAGPSDVIDGGAGIDQLTVIYAGFIASGTGKPPPVTLDISTGSGEVIVGGFRGENFTRIERLTFLGPDGNDKVTGGKYDDFIGGAGGNDILRAGDGNDTVAETAGFLNANGGAGTDLFTLDLSATPAADAVIDCRAGTLTLGGTNTGTFLNFEWFSITAGAGNDTLYAHSNGGFLIGDLGNDTIYGGDGGDSINGDRDLILGGGNDVIYGGDGNDKLTDLNGNNILDAGSGNDNIIVGGNVDHVYGRSGDDFVGWRLNKAAAGATYDGGAGFDILSFDVPTDAIDITGFAVERFEELREYIYGGTFYTVTMTTAQFAQFQRIDMPSGFATLALADNSAVVMPQTSIFGELKLAGGGQRADFSAVTADDLPIVTGGSGDDTVVGIANYGPRFEANLADGNDTFIGGVGRERVSGGSGNDVISGGGGNSPVSRGDDVLLGQDGNDQLFGGNRNDVLDGGNGKDAILGGAGNDAIKGGAGADRLDGGAGLDKFVYARAANSTGRNFDIVTGFDFKAQDRFDLKPVITGIDTAVTGGTLSKASFDAGLAAAVGSGQLAAGHAALFKPDAGDYAGKTFLVIETNGIAGYQAKADLVIMLKGPANLSSLDIADFT